MINDHASIICGELNIPIKNVIATLRLLGEGATVPFISRYRKEATGLLDEVAIRAIQLRDEALTELDKRKEYILETISKAGALTDELKSKINSTCDSTGLEDLFLPYKPRRRTRAEIAREKGFEPLARIIMAQNIDDITRPAARFSDAENPDEAIAGALDIIAEWISENEKCRSIIRAKYNRTAIISAKVIKGKETVGQIYRNYFEFSEPLRICSSHRYLALRRGEAEGVLKISLSIDEEDVIERLSRLFIRQSATKETAKLIQSAIKDSYRRLIKPSIETEVANAAKERADKAAIDLFADNVRQLLLAPPLLHKRVLAVDPGFRTGCKVVCLDEQGSLLSHTVIYPCAPANDLKGSASIVIPLIEKYHIDAIAIGSGTAGRETKQFMSSLLYPRPVQIFMVNEDGASVYSASEVARREFPDYDVTVRGAVSIGRRLIDPLAELVKIDPKSIGVGQYQHDVDQNKLKDSLDFTVSSCVNAVGVNINTASRELLSYVSGIGQTLAGNIIDYRAANGDFTNRTQLLNVPRMGEKTYQQCAGFLRIQAADNPLDNTGIHPESYGIVERMASDLGISVKDLINNPQTTTRLNLSDYTSPTVGLPTLTDILTELEKPGRDPREAPQQIATNDSLTSISDLSVGMELQGTVNNITAFGAFIDLGIKENGLIHISQISNKFITSPAEAVKIGQIVNVRVIEVDMQRGRISLSMKNIPQP